MISLIFNILMLVILAAFVAFNVPYTTSVNLFGYVVEEISTVAIILISLVAGVLFSFLFYLAEGVRKAGRKRQKVKVKELKEKEKALKEQAHEANERAKAPSTSIDAPNKDSGPLEKRGGKKKRSLFDRIRKKG